MIAMPFRLLTVSVFCLMVTACKKDISGETPAPTATPSDKLKDTVLAYSKDIYLWYKQIPATFDARTYADPGKIMEAIRPYSTEPGFSAPVDRWSFAMKRQEWDNISAGIAGDFGLGVFFRLPDDLRVKSVEAQSPAGRAGVRRGWRIIRINGNASISTANTDLVVNHVFNSNSTTFTFQKPDNSTVELQLTAAPYQEQPIMLDSVYEVGGRKAGYLVFNSFLGDTTAIYNGFSRIFNRFSQQGVNDVVVDLRYNGGGYVSVQEKLANYLAPLAAHGQLMLQQEFNDQYTEYNSTTRFSKTGVLNLNRIFFIVGNSTASASELLINSLKPYMNVVLVGPSKTYGKPVGFFPIPVGEWYIFPVSFRTTNKNGEGAYFNGLPLQHQVADGLDKDWGDLNETALASVVNYISGGGFQSGIARKDAPAGFQEQPQVRAGNATLDRPSFKGAIDTRGLR